MKTFQFLYRGGEIAASVFANTEEEAREYLRVGAPGPVWNETVHYYYLHPEFWECVDECELEED